MPLLQHRLEFGTSFEHVHTLLDGLDDLEPGGGPPLATLPEARVVPIGAFRGWRLSMCEAAPDHPLPDYATRRAWRTGLRADSTDILIFTDAAHSAFIWTWRARYRTGHTGYTEYNAMTGRRRLRAAIAVLPPALPVVGVLDAVDALVVERLSQAIMRNRQSAEDGDRLQAILDWVEGCDDPDQVRAAWRRLRSFSVLHPDCSDGRRLAKAGATLERAVIAMLDRMQSFVDDSLMRRDRRRPEHLRDLRLVTEAAEGPPPGFDRTQYVRRLIVQQNLFAVVASRSAGRTVLRDLLAFAGMGGKGIPLLDCNIWRTRDRDLAARRFLSRGHGDDNLTSGNTLLGEEVELHRKAWQMVRRIRLSADEVPEATNAACQLQKRRQLLLRQLRDLTDAGVETPRPEATAFCRAPATGQFSVRLGDGVG